MANILPTHKRVAILRSFVECNSIRATSRMVGCSKNTATKLLVGAGEACAAYQDATLRELPCRHVEVDEIWSFVGMKQKTADRKGGAASTAWATPGRSPPSIPRPSSFRPS